MYQKSQDGGTWINKINLTEKNEITKAKKKKKSRGSGKGTRQVRGGWALIQVRGGEREEALESNP